MRQLNIFRLILMMIVLALSGSGAMAQTQYYIGDADNQRAVRIKQMQDGSSVIAGYEFPAGGAVTNTQMTLMRVKNGTILWQEKFGMPGKTNLIYKFIVTHDSNIVVAGTIRDDVFAKNIAMLMEFRGSDGALLWQANLKDPANDAAGEAFWGVTELGAGGNYDLVAIGSRNFAGNMICVFTAAGTLRYEETMYISHQEYLYGACTSADGLSVYLCGVRNGNYTDAGVIMYTPNTTSYSGTIVWSKYYDYVLPGTDKNKPLYLQDNFFDDIFLSGSKLLILGGSLHDYTFTSGEGESIFRLNAADGSSPELWQAQNSGQIYANISRIAVANPDHVYNIQSPASSYQDPSTWLTGSLASSVVTDIQSLTTMTTGTPIKFTPAPGTYTLLDMALDGSNLFMAGVTSGGHGANDIYYTVAPTALPIDRDRACDVVDNIAMVSVPITPYDVTFGRDTFIPVYYTVTVTPTNYEIDTVCHTTHSYRCDSTFDMAATGISHIGDTVSCSYTITATTNTLPGWTVIGYLWNTPPVGNVWHPSGAGSDPLTVTALGSHHPVRVTIYAIDAFGDTCHTTLYDTIHCRADCGTSFDNAGTTLTHSGSFAQGRCNYSYNATAAPLPGWSVVGYLWQIDALTPSMVYSTLNTSGYGISLPPGGMSTAIVTIFVTNGFGDTCQVTRYDTAHCDQCQSFDSLGTNVTHVITAADPCKFMCTATGVTLGGWSPVGYLWEIGANPPIWHWSTSPSDGQLATAVGTTIVKVTFYAVDFWGDTCKTVRYDTLNCETPCYDIRKTNLVVTSTLDAMGNCVFTATASVTTANMILGYEWSSGGAPVIHYTGSSSDVYTFTLPPGGATTVSVIIHIVNPHFAPGTSPCCEANLSQRVSCGDTVVSHNCFDSLNLSYVSFAEGPGCYFTVTAHAYPLPGVTITSYDWVLGGGTPITDLTSSTTDSHGFYIPPGTSNILTVTVHGVNAAGDTCSYTKTIVLDCGKDPGTGCCFDSLKTFLSYIGTMDMSGRCRFTVTAHESIYPGCTFIGYIWQTPTFTSPIVTYNSIGVGPLFPYTSSWVTVTFIAVNSKGDTCKVTRTLTLDCGSHSTSYGCCFDSLNTNLTMVPSMDIHGNCIFGITANKLLLPGCTFIGYIWQTPSYTSGIVLTSTFSLTIPPMTSSYVNVTFIALNAAGDTCKVVRSMPLDCSGGLHHRDANGTDDSGMPKGTGDIRIFPNPTEDAVTITSTSADISAVQVIDVNGQKVGDYSYGATNGSTKSVNISLTGLPPGSYLFRVNNSSSRVVTKAK